MRILTWAGCFSVAERARESALSELVVLLRRVVADGLTVRTSVPLGSVPEEGSAFVWTGEVLEPVRRVQGVPLHLLRGIDGAKLSVMTNTLRFVQGHGANNILLWGARGTGKSALVKAVHGWIEGLMPRVVTLVEVHREDLGSLPQVMRLLRSCPHRRFIVFIDDLSFEALDVQYKSLKAILDGGLEGRPEHVIFYATSNRRHLMARDQDENALHVSDVSEEKVSLSDRFGLWLGFHGLDQETYLEIVEGYVGAYGLQMAPDALRAEALAWSVGRGSRSGRVAWQFVVHLAGRQGMGLES